MQTTFITGAAISTNVTVGTAVGTIALVGFQLDLLLHTYQELVYEF